MGGGHVSRPDFGMPQPDAAYPLTEFYLLAQQALEKSGSFMLPALYAGLQAPARRIYREEAADYLQLAAAPAEGLTRLLSPALKGGTPEQCAAAAAMALGNLLGLVCDPVAGLVEVPCIKRNVVGAVNAVSCANMALAGVDYAIPCDEVIDAMGRVGSLLSPDLRETGQGGLAATPTGVKIARQLAQEN